MTANQKLLSLSLFQKHGLPVIPYMRLSEITFGEDVAAFIRTYQVDRVMVRTDGKGLASPAFNDAIWDGKMQATVKELFKDGYTVFVMHPADIYKNMYSFNLLRDGEGYTIEVVGHGFIATDLNRYGIMHESLFVSDDFTEVKCEYLVKQEKYSADRLKKIDELGLDSEDVNTAYILQYEEYLPFYESDMFEILAKYASGIRNFMHDPVYRGVDLVLSGSFIDIGRGQELVFWDAHPVK